MQPHQQDMSILELDPHFWQRLGNNIFCILKSISSQVIRVLLHVETQRWKFLGEKSVQFWVCWPSDPFLPTSSLLCITGGSLAQGSLLGVANKRQLLWVWKAGGREKVKSPSYSASLLASFTSTNHMSFFCISFYFIELPQLQLSLVTPVPEPR